MKYIYHIHDQICGHSTNTLDQIVSIALSNEYKELFYTEHCPLDNNSIIFRPTWYEIYDLKKRIDVVNKKYAGKLKIHFGLEVEFSKWNTEYFINLKNNHHINYLIFGNHYVGDMWTHPKLVMDYAKTKKDLDEYLENTILAFESGIFSWFAHPDIWLNAYHKWDQNAKQLTKQLISLCEKYDMPMGFNANGMFNKRDGFNYPSSNFWQLVAKSKVKVIVEADAHYPQALASEWLEDAKKEAIRFGLKDNLVDQITIHYFNL